VQSHKSDGRGDNIGREGGGGRIPGSGGKSYELQKHMKGSCAEKSLPIQQGGLKGGVWEKGGS